MHLEAFVNYLTTEKRYSENTITAYKTDVGYFLTYLQEEYEINKTNEITAPILRSFLAAQVEEGLSNRSINRRLSSIKAYFNYCKRQGIVDNNVANLMNALKVQNSLPTYVEKDMIIDLINNLPKQNYPEYRDFLIVYLLYALGLRRSELIALRYSNFNLITKEVKVLGKGQKERLIPLSEQTVAVLKEFRRIKEDFFNDIPDVLLTTDKGKKLYPNFIYRKINQLLSLKTTQKKKSPHTLRHSFATHLLNKGADIMSIKELLGHQSLEATQVYTHTNIEELKKIYKKSHPSS